MIFYIKKCSDSTVIYVDVKMRVHMLYENRDMIRYIVGC